MRNSQKKSVFTLIEIVVVLVVVMLISGIVLASVRVPGAVSLDKISENVKKIFADAARQSALQGTEFVVEYNKDERFIGLYKVPPEDEQQDSDSEWEPPDGKTIKAKNPHNYIKIPEQVKVTFPDYEEDQDSPAVLYRFFPNGEASGPEVEFTYKNRNIRLGVSHLTGMFYTVK